MSDLSPGVAGAVVILGVDSVLEKTLYQTRWLAEHDVETVILAYHRDHASIRSDPSTEIIEIPASPLARIRRVWRLLRIRRGTIHHVELYPGGRFAFVFALMARMLRLRVVTVERGDLLQCLRRRYPLLVRLSVYACYRLSHAVWYREPYMGPPLRRWRVRAPFMLANAVPMPSSSGGGRRSIDYVWVNRLIPERHPDWFAGALHAIPEGERFTAAVVGFSTQSPTDLETSVRERLESHPAVECHAFSDPRPFYESARFFVLPADIVFANFALLEAMAHGVVPIVFEADGTDLLVRDGENGLVVPPTPESLREGLIRAIGMPEEEWARLSAAARSTIEREHSLDAWGRRLLRHYEAVSA